MKITTDNFRSKVAINGPSWEDGCELVVAKNPSVNTKKWTSLLALDWTLEITARTYDRYVKTRVNGEKI